MCVAITQLLSPDLRLASSILFLLRSVVEGGGSGSEELGLRRSLLLASWPWEPERGAGPCCHGLESRIEGGPGFAKTA